MLETLRLPFSFDAAALKADLANFAESDWTPHFNQSYYEGDWSGIALRAAKGAHLDIYPDPAATGFEDTDMLGRCAYIPKALDIFECELESVRFLRLGAGAKILEHRDYMLSIEDGVARIHVPVVTNPQVEFRLGGKLLQMGEGDAWYLNFNLPHSVVNNSPATRVHLVVDCIANEWLRNVLGGKQ